MIFCIYIHCIHDILIWYHLSLCSIVILSLSVLLPFPHQKIAKVDPQELMKAKAVPGVTWMASIRRSEILSYNSIYIYIHVLYTCIDIWHMYDSICILILFDRIIQIYLNVLLYTWHICVRIIICIHTMIQRTSTRIENTTNKKTNSVLDHLEKVLVFAQTIWLLSSIWTLGMHWTLDSNIA